MLIRFVQSSSPDRLAAALGRPLGGVQESVPRYNIGPPGPVLMLRPDGNGGLTLGSIGWGLVPAWKQDRDARGIIGARAETLTRRRGFREPLRQRRGVVPADGFYAWCHECSGRYPYFIADRNGAPLFFAALWEADACAIILAQGDAPRPFPEELPVALEGEALNRWLDPNEATPERLLRAPAWERLSAHRIGPAIDEPTAEGPQLIAPL